MIIDEVSSPTLPNLQRNLYLKDSRVVKVLLVVPTVSTIQQGPPQIPSQHILHSCDVLETSKKSPKKPKCRQELVEIRAKYPAPGTFQHLGVA